MNKNLPQVFIKIFMKDSGDKYSISLEGVKTRTAMD